MPWTYRKRALGVKAMIFPIFRFSVSDSVFHLLEKDQSRTHEKFLSEKFSVACQHSISRHLVEWLVGNNTSAWPSMQSATARLPVASSACWRFANTCVVQRTSVRAPALFAGHVRVTVHLARTSSPTKKI